MVLTGANRSTGEETVPVPLCPPQIAGRLARDRRRVSAVRRQRLTVSEDQC